MPDSVSTEAPVRVYAASHDGQAARIAEHIARRLNEKGLPTAYARLGTGEAPAAELADARLLVLIAAIRYGFHLPSAKSFLVPYKRLSAPPPLGLATVCLTARKPNKQSVENNVYLRKLIRRQDLHPAAAVAIAGKLNYPVYRWFDRQMIRLIMKMTKGPTDGVSVIEYTNWAQVDDYADQLAQIALSSVTR